MTVDGTGFAVGGPSGVRDGDGGDELLGHVGCGLVDELLELSHLSDLLVEHDLLGLVAVDGHTGRVIAAVLESREAGEEEVDDVLSVPLDEEVEVAKDAAVAGVR